MGRIENTGKNQIALMGWEKQIVLERVRLSEGGVGEVRSVARTISGHALMVTPGREAEDHSCRSKVDSNV